MPPLRNYNNSQRVDRPCMLCMSKAKRPKMHGVNHRDKSVPRSAYYIIVRSGGSRGGGSRGSGPPPLLGHDVGFLTLGPKLDPPFVNVQEWGCFSNFLRSDDVTRTMSKGGGVLVNVQEWGVFQIF